MLRQPILFTGCVPEIAAGPDGRIIAVGAGAKAAAGRGAQVVRLQGKAQPGFIDSHLHLEGLASRHLTLDLTDVPSLDAALVRVRRWADRLPKDAWVVGRGWYNDLWPDPAFPSRKHLDEAAGGRPVFLTRKDGHSAWVSTATLRLAKVDRSTQDPAGGVIDHDASGEATGILRETAMKLGADLVPPPTEADLDRAMSKALVGLARLGVTSAQSMDTSRGFASLQRIHAKGGLKVRVTYNLPLGDLKHAERLGVRSGWGDDWLRIWGVKAFLDGSLGSRTAEMLDGTGTTRLSQPDLIDMIQRCAKAELNVCLHAIGDGAVRRALDALGPFKNAWPKWRPRIEHVQCVNPKDMPRFARFGVIASMQPIHAVADRELADALWPKVVRHAYAWAPLEKAGATLAFGSDAPVESADPLAGMDAATAWRKRAKWHPDLALSKASAMRAYTRGAAFAVGMENVVGALKPGMLCDLTIVEDGGVAASIVGGKVSWRRTPSSTSRR